MENPEATPYSNDEQDRFCKRIDYAIKRRTLYEPIIDEAYEYALPLRERTYSGGDPLPDLSHLFDSTAIQSVQALASQMLDDIWPTDSKPFELKAGKEVPEDQREEVDKGLAEVTEDLVETINNSNFRSVAHEALMDWTIGEGFILPEDGSDIDPTVPLINRTLSLTEAITDIGPTGSKDLLARKRKVRGGDVMSAYPDATLSQDLKDAIKKDENKDFVFLEGWERDRTNRGTETWVWRVISMDVEIAGTKKEMIERKEISGAGSKPFVDFSYMRTGNEVMGRGPTMLALPTIKTVNLVQQLILENADMALAGMYQAEDDGVLNPDTVIIEPRTVIPIAPGSAGLRPVESAGNFNLSDMVIRDLQNQIIQIMLGDDLGAPEGTPMSATEVMARTSNTARRRAGPYTRLLVELLQQYVKRVAYIRVKQGKIKLPPIDGRKILIRPLGPLTRAQGLDEVQRHVQYMQFLNELHGPQQAQIIVNADESSKFLAKKLGIDARVLRSKADQEQIIQAIAQMAAMQAQGTQAA